MSRISIAVALAVLLLASFGSAQQTASDLSGNSEPSSSPTPPPGPIIGGMGTTNYIPIWASSVFLLDSVIYQANGDIGIGTTSPQATLDVNGGADIRGDLSASAVSTATTYGIGAYTVLSIAGAPGSQNTFVGIGAGSFITSGDNNTFIGAAAGSANTEGTFNTFSGVAAGYKNTYGTQETFSGWGAGFNNTTGNQDTFYGSSAGDLNTSGSGNTFIGLEAGYNNTTGNNDVYIANLGPTSGEESSTIRIGGDIGQGYGPQTATYIAGIYGVNVVGVPVQINSNGQLGAATSSLRFKEQVRDMGDSTSALMKLRPVTFLYKSQYADGERTLQYGLIAEEVAKIYPELVAYDNDGQPYSVRYQYLSTMLLNEVQKQYRRAEAEAKVISTQQDEIQALQEQNRDFQERLLRMEKLVPQTVAQK